MKKGVNEDEEVRREMKMGPSRGQAWQEEQEPVVYDTEEVPLIVTQLRIDE